MNTLLATLTGAGVDLIIVLILAWPLVVIWALNTLFTLSIAYSFKTWLAVLILNATLASAAAAGGRSKT